MKGQEPSPPGLAPATLVATWFGVGHLPLAPGTWASISALPLAWFVHAGLGAPGLLLAAFGLFAAGLWACRQLPAKMTENDPGHVVIDEVAGQVLTLVGFAAVSRPDGIFYLTGFALFRFFDILKPWPVDWAQRTVKGPLGIMLDDVLAALYAGAGLWFIHTQSH
jgi:phosphatidylglycerophosphatase A